MSTLLVGDATEDYSASNNIFDGLPTAFKFTAVATDTLDTLAIRAAEVESSPDTLELGIYADAAGVPGALLDSGVIAGPFGASEWVQVTGLSASIVDGTDYHLAALSVGGNFYLRGGAAIIAEIRDNTTRASLQSTWDTASSVDYGEDGHPVGFQGLKGVLPDETPPEATFRDSGLEWHITGLWHPDDTSVAYYGRIADPSADRVDILLDDQRKATVTLATREDVAAAVRPGLTYQRCLRGYYHGQLVYWAPINSRETDAAAGTITLSSVDTSLRLQRHQLRRGDLLGTLSEANDDKGSVSVDHIGLRQLRDAGLNTTEQTDRGVPDLGIIDGTNDVPETPFNRIGVTRGDQVWNAMLQLSQSLGPDFELEPIEDTVGAYARLNTYVHQGDDVSAAVALHWGTGKDNLEDIRDAEGAKYTTHVHALPRDLKFRFTQANEAASAATGPYVDWDPTDYDSEGIDPAKVEDVLRAYGDDLLAAYSRPLQACDLTLPVEDASSYLYLRDYRIGDTIAVAARRDLYELDSSFYRIVGVSLVHEGNDDDVRPQLTVVADRVAELGDTLTNAGEGVGE